MGFDLEALGPEAFEDLIGALLIAQFGAKFQAMGPGRDGGRDVIYKGQLIWSGTDGRPGAVWDGYTVVQVKQRQQPASTPRENAQWLWGQIREELDKWTNPQSGRSTLPDYVLFVTNIGLSPFPEVGGFDQIRSNIESYISQLDDASRDLGSGEERRARLARARHVREWMVWDRAQVQALLTVHDGVRNRFPAFLTPGDLLAQIGEVLGDSAPANLGIALEEHARRTIVGENNVYFDEAGASDGAGTPLHEVFVDLPVSLAGSTDRISLTQFLLDQGEHVLRRSLSPVTSLVKTHVILVGAPGNGKTTLSRALVQIYRAAFLEGSESLGVNHEVVIRGLRTALERNNVRFPLHRRWPIRLDLANYAQHHGFEQDSTILRAIAESVAQRSDHAEVTPARLRTWMRRWPCLVVLDGLDEVTEPAVRKRLIQQVEEFVAEADADDHDLFVVLTTRPVGFAEEISPGLFIRAELADLTPNEAVRYGTLATRVRLRNDPDRAALINRRLLNAAGDDSLKNLLRTPLQILIITIIISGSGRLHPDRYRLFWTYYDTVYRREREKNSPLSRVLQENQPQIQQLHELVGFELQRRSESGEKTVPRLERARLEDLTRVILTKAGYEPEAKDSDLLKRIVTAATHRLVLIVPKGDEGYGFDVRSLQELMTGRYLSNGPVALVAARLRTAAPNPYWRNAWIFAAGRIFAAGQEHEQASLVRLIENIDVAAEERLGGILPVGPTLALSLIDDGVTRAYPSWRDRLSDCSFGVLDEPGSPDLYLIARALVRFADYSDGQRNIVADGIRKALSRSQVARTNAIALQGLVDTNVDALGAKPATRGLSAVRSSHAPPPAVSDPWQDASDEIETSPLPNDTVSRVRDVVQALRGLPEGELLVEADAVLQLLQDPDSAQLFEKAVSHVVPLSPAVILWFREKILPTILRRPIGGEMD